MESLKQKCIGMMLKLWVSFAGVERDNTVAIARRTALIERSIDMCEDYEQIVACRCAIHTMLLEPYGHEVQMQVINLRSKLGWKALQVRIEQERKQKEKDKSS